MGARQQREIRQAGGKEIGVGEEPAFDACFRGSQSARELRFGQVEHRLRNRGIRLERRDELGGGGAFDDRQRFLGNVALCEPVEQMRQRDACGDLVVPRLDGPVRLPGCEQAQRAETRSAALPRRRARSRPT